MGDLARRLAACLGARVELTGRATVGLSQETWFVRVDGREAVLRLPTPASGPRAIVRQRTALQVVAGSAVPAPELLAHDDGEANQLGRPFLLMSRVEGEVPVGWHELPEPRRALLAEQAIDALVALHELDPAPLGAADPSPAAELARYRRRLAPLEPLPPALRAGLWWLERHVPAPAPKPVLAHGDLRMGNLVVDGDRLAGVLDWELAAPGDPLLDVAWCFIAVWAPPGVDEDALVARYAARSGREVDAERLRWFRVLGYARLAYYALSGSHAFAAGASDDLRLAALRYQVPVALDRLARVLAGEELA